MQRFYEQVEDGKEIAKRAKGMLILPNVGKGALIVGIEYGRGALRVGGKTVDYYSMAAGSLGFRIGGEAKDIIITFNNDEALKQIRAAKGWEAGIDGNVALFTVGGGEKTLVAMNKNPNYKGCPVEPVFNGMLSDFISSGERANGLIHQRRTSG